MTTHGTCSNCGGAIPDDAPGLECPKCLLLAGLTPPAGAEEDSFSAGELEEAFPNLAIIEPIGRGGMGVVFKVRQRSLDRVAALKILPRPVAADPAFVERFTREAKALASLSHPNVVAVHESGKTGDLCYLLMEYVDGVNLRQALAEGQLSPAEALKVVPQVCSALQYAHDRGVVHRDIKPENILLARDGAVKIADFGLAKLLKPTVGDATLTSADQVMGTYHYMAPEQIRTPKDVDHRADIYSLGVVFYEMLTGDLPLGRFQPPSRKVEVDVRLDRVVLRSLEQERERRYQSAEAVKTAVDTLDRRPAVRPRKGARTIERAGRSRNAPFSKLALIGFAIAPITILWGLFSVASGGSVDAAVVNGSLFCVLGIALSGMGWVRIRESRGTLRGLDLAKIGVFLPIVVYLFVVLLENLLGYA